MDDFQTPPQNSISNQSFIQQPDIRQAPQHPPSYVYQPGGRMPHQMGPPPLVNPNVQVPSRLIQRGMPSHMGMGGVHMQPMGMPQYNPMSLPPPMPGANRYPGGMQRMPPNIPQGGSLPQPFYSSANYSQPMMGHMPPPPNPFDMMRRQPPNYMMPNKDDKKDPSKNQWCCWGLYWRLGANELNIFAIGRISYPQFNYQRNFWRLYLFFWLSRWIVLAKQTARWATCCPDSPKSSWATTSSEAERRSLDCSSSISRSPTRTNSSKAIRSGSVTAARTSKTGHLSTCLTWLTATSVSPRLCPFAAISSPSSVYQRCSANPSRSRPSSTCTAGQLTLSVSVWPLCAGHRAHARNSN